MNLESLIRRGNGWLMPVALAVADWAWIWLWTVIVETWIGAPARASLLAGWWILALLLAGRATIGAVRRIPSPRLRGAIAIAAGLVFVILAARLLAFSGRPILDLRWLDEVAERPVRVWSDLQYVDLVIVMGLLAWFRGARLGSRASLSEAVQSTFVVGLVGLAAGLLAIAIVPASSALSSVGGALVVVYLGAGMLAVALARIDEINREQRRNQDVELGLGAHWAVSVAVVLVVLLLIASALSGFLTFDRIDAALRPLGAALDFVLEVAILAIAVPVGFLLEAIVWLVRMLLGKPAKPPQPPHVGNLAPRQTTNQQLAGLSPELATFVHLLGGAALVVVIGLILYRSLAWWSDLDRVEGVPELRDFVVGWADLRAAALRWLERLLGRARRRASSGGRTGAETVAAAATSPRTVREVYREFLRFGRRAGFPRQPGQTPAEYARHPAFASPALAEPLDRLTESYVRARYGELDLGDEVVDESRLALERIRRGILEQSPVGESIGTGQPGHDRQES
ncbi:MAG: DUF4129 domain-containing protein [Chloroflexota bacterium]